jgi:hypothetical protein
MNWKGYRRRRSWVNLRHHPDISLEGLRKTKKSIIVSVSADNRIRHLMNKSETSLLQSAW